MNMNKADMLPCICPVGGSCQRICDENHIQATGDRFYFEKFAKQKDWDIACEIFDNRFDYYCYQPVQMAWESWQESRHQSPPITPPSSTATPHAENNETGLRQGAPDAKADSGNGGNAERSSQVASRQDNPAPVSPHAEIADLKIGKLATVNQDEYPALPSWWIQIWDGDVVRARVYGNSPNEAKDNALALLDRLQGGRIPSWQPIETAPKDIEILVHNPVTGPYRSIYVETYGTWPCRTWGSEDGTWYPQPTHWMPLPAAPSNKADGEGEVSASAGEPLPIHKAARYAANFLHSLLNDPHIGPAIQLVDGEQILSQLEDSLGDGGGWASAPSPTPSQSAPASELVELYAHPAGDETLAAIRGEVSRKDLTESLFACVTFIQAMHKMERPFNRALFIARCGHDELDWDKVKHTAVEALTELLA